VQAPVENGLLHDFSSDVKHLSTTFFHLKSLLEVSLFTADELKEIQSIVEKYEEPFCIENAFIVPKPFSSKIEIMDNVELDNATHADKPNDDNVNNTSPEAHNFKLVDIHLLTDTAGSSSDLTSTAISSTLSTHVSSLPNEPLHATSSSTTESSTVITPNATHGSDECVDNSNDVYTDLPLNEPYQAPAVNDIISGQIPFIENVIKKIPL
jgi:hypothetical protein